MVVVVVWGPRRPEDTLCDGLQANPPELDQAEDLASLVSVNESSVLNTLLHRYQAQLPHTHAGPDLIFLQPQGLMAPSAGKVRGPQGRGGARPGSFCISGPEPPEPLQACLSGILQTWLLGCQSIGEPWGPHGPPSLEGKRRDTNRTGARETVTVGENVSDGVRSVRLCFRQLCVSSQPVLRSTRGRGPRPALFTGGKLGQLQTQARGWRSWGETHMAGPSVL